MDSRPPPPLIVIGNIMTRDLRASLLIKFILVALVLLVFHAAPVFAATINVDATCSLAQAINEANEATTDTGSCEAGDDADSSASPPKDGHDTIMLTPDTPGIYESGGTYTLTAALPALSTKITIDGNGLRISGNDAYRVFNITSSGDVKLENQVIRNGAVTGDGGAIYVAGKLTLRKVAVQNSAASGRGGGIFVSSGDVTITKSAIISNTASGNGGGIYVVDSNFTPTNVTVAENSAAQGGGIYVTGTVSDAVSRIHYVTITRNSATSNPGGGGILNNSRALQVSRSIIYGNTAGGVAENCHLTGSPTVDFRENIVGPSSAAACTNNQDTRDPLLVDELYWELNPPVSRLYEGSPALNAGPPDSPPNCWSNTTDQQNNTRPQGSGCDYGAWEGEGRPLPAQTPAAPKASFTAAVDTGNVLRWTFDASGSSGSITSYAWTFGDGNSGTGQTTAHSYSSGGSYTVTLTATGPGGSDSATQSISVSQPVQAPVASFTYSVNGNQASFTSTSTGSNLSFSWDVNGDGAADYSDQNPSHSYPNISATYSVTLTVSNSAGSNSATQSIPVTQLLTAQLSSNAVLPPVAPPVGSAGSAGSASFVSGTARPEPTPSTCESLPANIEVKPRTEQTQCQRVAGAAIGDPMLAAAATEAVDVWSWVKPDTKVCFKGDSGAIRFTDTAAMPRRTMDKETFSDGGMICAMIDGPGIAVLVEGPPRALATPAAPAPQRLSGCMVKTKEILYFRESPGGGLVIRDWIPNSWLPKDVTLTAMEEKSGWYKVDYYGVEGWISGDYVEPKGNCG